MKNTFVVGYDGSEGSKRALEFAKARAKAASADLVVAYVLEWSPYSFLTPDELEERHARRKQELSRAEEAIINPVKAELGDFKVETVIKYGQIAETLNGIAEETGAAQIFIGRSGESISTRVFGSTAGKLAQMAKVPCTIVP